MPYLQILNKAKKSKEGQTLTHGKEVFMTLAPAEGAAEHWQTWPKS